MELPIARKLPEVFVALHPAYVLRVPQARATVVADLRRVRDRYMPVEAVPWSWWQGEEIPDVPLGFDIETDYDKNVPGSGENVTQIAIATREHVWVAIGDDVAALARQLIGKKWVFHFNGWSFDCPKVQLLLDSSHGSERLRAVHLAGESQADGMLGVERCDRQWRLWDSDETAKVDERTSLLVRDGVRPDSAGNACMPPLRQSEVRPTVASLRWDRIGQPAGHDNEEPRSDGNVERSPQADAGTGDGDSTPLHRSARADSTAGGSVRSRTTDDQCDPQRTTLDVDNPKCHALGILVPHGIDVTALAYLDDEAQPLGLESLAVKYLRVRGWKEERTAELGTPEFAVYNARDAWYTLRLAEHFWRLLGQRRRIVTEIMAPARLALDACTTRGAPLALDRIRAHRQRFDAAIERAEQHVHELAVEGEFNPNSPRQIAAVLVRRGHVLKTTASEMPATDKGALESLNDAFAQAVLAYRSARKALSTYVIPYQRAAEAGARVHSIYTLWRTVTGRTSARNPNIQNVPRELKDIFPCVRVDYAAIEFWLAAWCANAHSILDRKRSDPGWDPHRHFAAMYYSVRPQDVTKDQRQTAKTQNFRNLYNVVLDRCETTGIVRAWHETFPEFIPWYRQTLEEMEALGYSETATGFRRHYGDFRLLYGPQRLAALREGVNVKVQGLAAHVALIGLAACHRDGYPICGFIHDEFMFDYTTRDAFEKDSAGIVRNMTQEPVRVLRERFGVDLSVSLSVEATLPENLL